MSGQVLTLLISVLSVPEPLLSDSCYFARGLETHLQLSKQHSVLLYESVKEAEKEANPFSKQVYNTGGGLHNHKVYCEDVVNTYKPYHFNMWKAGLPPSRFAAFVRIYRNV